MENINYNIASTQIPLKESKFTSKKPNYLNHKTLIALGFLITLISGTLIPGYLFLKEYNTTNNITQVEAQNFTEEEEIEDSPASNTNSGFSDLIPSTTSTSGDFYLGRENLLIDIPQAGISGTITRRVNETSIIYSVNLFLPLLLENETYQLWAEKNSESRELIGTLRSTSPGFYFLNNEFEMPKVVKREFEDLYNTISLSKETIDDENREKVLFTKTFINQTTSF